MATINLSEVSEFALVLCALGMRRGHIETETLVLYNTPPRWINNSGGSGFGLLVIPAHTKQMLVRKCQLSTESRGFPKPDPILIRFTWMFCFFLHNFKILVFLVQKILRFRQPGMFDKMPISSSSQSHKCLTYI